MWDNLKDPSQRLCHLLANPSSKFRHLEWASQFLPEDLRLRASTICQDKVIVVVIVVILIVVILPLLVVVVARAKQIDLGGKSKKKTKRKNWQKKGAQINKQRKAKQKSLAARPRAKMAGLRHAHKRNPCTEKIKFYL